MDPDLEAARDRRIDRLSFRASAAAIYTGAALLLWYPAVFLALGVQAIGDKVGWWRGDPNSDDGEESFATTIGAVSIVLVLVIAALVTRRVGRHFLTDAIAAVIIGTTCILVAICALCGLFVFG